MKYVVYHINEYLFHTKSHECIVNQTGGVYIEATNKHIYKEIVSCDKTFYYGFSTRYMSSRLSYKKHSYVQVWFGS